MCQPVEYSVILRCRGRHLLTEFPASLGNGRRRLPFPHIYLRKALDRVVPRVLADLFTLLT
ncbi:hypothetical protein GCM10010256_36340 [Streptomyces coeruleorubidus]|nr:hypothetical protein GCM10010256_36340 [Streptomyces coeruleorubidus]